jgi:two-component system response regulator AtoC
MSSPQHRTVEHLTRSRGLLGRTHPWPIERASHFAVFENDSSRLERLPTTGDCIIGRGDEATLKLTDAAISRKHARVTLSPTSTLIIDLGSHNGTQVNGQRIAGPRPLLSGDVVTICGTQLVFYCQPSPSRSRSLLNAEDFRSRVEEELERGLQSGTPAILVSVDFPKEQPDVVHWVQGLNHKLSLTDLGSFLTKSELCLYLPETDRCEEMIAAIQAIDATARIGVASAPSDGVDYETLLQAARCTHDQAPHRSVVKAHETVTRRDVGGIEIVIADPTMRRVYDLVDRLSQSDLPVLIGGETGTGKELIARALHAGSRRHLKPLRNVNCAALPEGLAESELFGHAKGAFSGATQHRAGLFESAQGGTVFLDELGDLPMALQPKLLRVLETKRVIRVGEVEERPVDVRMVAATHKDLSAEVSAGRFRQDLVYRLGAARIVLPALRERPREISHLAMSFLARACLENQRKPMAFSPGAMAELMTYRWPGNIRELKNVMELVAATLNDSVVQAFHLESLLQPELHRPAAPQADIEEPAPETFVPIDDEVRALEARRMRQALAACQGVKKAAAELISMPLRTFNTKYKLYQL